MEEITTFDDVRRFLNSIPGISKGGCGISALAMYRWLKKEKLTNYRVKFALCYGSDGLEVCRENLRVFETKSGTAAACWHIGLYFDNEIIDCEGIINPGDYEVIQFARDEWFIVNAINNVRTWNKTFNRDNISSIERALNINLSDIKPKGTPMERLRDCWSSICSI